MPAKLVKIETPEECLRLWKAGLVVSADGGAWSSIPEYKGRQSINCPIRASVNYLYDAYVWVDDDGADTND